MAQVSPLTLLAVVYLSVTLISARSPFETWKVAKAWGKQSVAELTKNSAVQQMSMDTLEEMGASILLHGQPIGHPLANPSVGAPFHWESCGTADQLVDIKNLTIGPSPLSFPGVLTFGFDISFRDTITADTVVAADLKLQVNARGSWIDIPCIGGIGSCKYDNVCSLMSKIQCPADLTQQGIPCSCPFNKGEYKLKKYSVQVDAAVVLSGDYKATAVLSEPNNGQIACYKVAFTVA